ncbi:protease-like protein [Polyplosphaeria fusca]|uniref:Protease-like protein n=1 Tax=Polyplosphaeria fusca TaxID=682080 RepID=A0A9P4QW19_9PLEO|nr:protease-like protein [Polyplosphaeria fusca]
MLQSTRSPASTTASSPGPDGPTDLSQQINDSVRHRFVIDTRPGHKLGEGTYAIVFSGHYRTDPTHLVAVKRIKKNADYHDGIAPDAFREIQFLSELSHPNIITLHAVFSTKSQTLSLVLEHLPGGDLEQLFQTPRDQLAYSASDFKAWALMLLRAVAFIHASGILHRDIKGNNILIAADNTLKLADFGLARAFAEPGRNMTHQVITRFYRPPELLYGAMHYGAAVDVWSTGVVLVELCIRDFFLPANTDVEQFHVVEHMFGTPTEESWPGVSSLPFYNLSSAPPKQAQWRAWAGARLQMLGGDGLEVVSGMLAVDPRRRWSAERVLRHAYWGNEPQMTRKELLPRVPGKGGKKKVGEDLKRGAEGEGEGEGRVEKVARKLDFGSMRN